MIVRTGIPDRLIASDQSFGAGSGHSSLITHHSSLIQQVDRAVRSILQGLERGPEGEDGIFAGRLLSLRQAEALRAGTREVKVAPGTVITPLARDFLKGRGIGLRVVSRLEVEAVRERGEWGFAIEAETGTTDALRRAWLDGPEPWTELEPMVGTTARWVIERPGRGALLLTDEASVAVWRACRLVGVRAATAAEPEAVVRAVRRLGVNLLVVEPAGKPIALVRQLGLAFRKAGAPRIPEGLMREGLA